MIINSDIRLLQSYKLPYLTDKKLMKELAGCEAVLQLTQTSSVNFG